MYLTVVAKKTQMLTSSNGVSWDGKRPCTIYQALDEKGREVMFDIDLQKLQEKAARYGHTLGTLSLTADTL